VLGLLPGRSSGSTGVRSGISPVDLPPQALLDRRLKKLKSTKNGSIAMANSEDSWHFQGKDEGALPLDLIDKLWEYFQSRQGKLEHIRPSKGQLGMIISPAYQASLQAEEGRSVRFRVVFNFSADQATVRFKDLRDYTASHLVKLAPTVGIATRWIVATPGQSADTPLKIVGICDPELTPHQPFDYHWEDRIVRPHGITLSVFDPGVLRVATQHNALELRAGQILQPAPLSRIQHVEDWFKDASNLLGVSHPPSGLINIKGVWNGILGKVCNARHGGCFLLVPDDFNLPGRHLKINYPLDLARLQEAIQARLKLEPALSMSSRKGGDSTREDLYDAPFLERDMLHIADLVASLAAIDGAIILTRSLRIVGYGSEILLTERPEEGEKIVYTHESGDKNFELLANVGMRHRSAFRFCKKNPETIALVISQDGGIKVFCNVRGEVEAFRNVFPDEWLT
jgi:hypothetical protein